MTVVDPLGQAYTSAASISSSNNGEALHLHHIGFVVPSIDDAISDFVSLLSTEWDGNIFNDPLQRVKVTFLRSPVPGNAKIELVEPLGDCSPVVRFLKTGGGLHHLCYEVADLRYQLKEMHSRGALIVRRPLRAVAFENRLVGWVLTSNKLLLELLEGEAK